MTDEVEYWIYHEKQGMLQLHFFSWFAAPKRSKTDVTRWAMTLTEGLVGVLSTLFFISPETHHFHLLISSWMIMYPLGSHTLYVSVFSTSLVALLCGQHALNNLVQANVFSPEKLVQIAHRLDQLELDVMAQNNEGGRK